MKSLETFSRKLNRAMKKFNGLPVLYYYRASIYAVLGKFALALKNLQKAVDGDSKYIQMATSNACFKSIAETVEFNRLLNIKANKH